MSITMSGIFTLLERISLRNTGTAGLDDKVRFGETVCIKLTSVKDNIEK
jgi:hypothetical protein